MRIFGFAAALGLVFGFSVATFEQAVAAPSGGAPTPSAGPSGGSSSSSQADVKEDYKNGLTSFEAVGRLSPLQFSGSNQFRLLPPPSQVISVVQPLPEHVMVPVPVIFS